MPESLVNIVVLGAGVSGLTSALLLSRDKRNAVTVVAKHMPGDYDIEYASPWAGASWKPVTQGGTTSAKYEEASWPELYRLARELPEAGIHVQDNTTFYREKDKTAARRNAESEKDPFEPWYKDLVPNFRILDKSELPDGVQSGVTFTSVCINTALYLPWLASQCLRNGVIVKRGVVDHVAEAASLHHTGSPANIIVNCTGLSSRTLGGIEDSSLYPARGQIVVVRNDPRLMISMSGTDDGYGEETYMMHRAAGGGCILGGTYQKNQWDSQPDPNIAARIMKRCVDVCPDLTGGQGPEKLSIVRHGVGLRPVRDGGPRVAKEKIEGLHVVSNYGHGGYGYQQSYGCAKEVVQLVAECVGEVDF